MSHIKTTGRERWGVTLIFGVHGLITGNLAARFADVQEDIGASVGPFGVALVGATVGAIVGAKPSGWFGERHGARNLTRTAMLLTAVSVTLLGIASDVSTLFLVFVIFGIAAAGMNVGMNLLALEAETASGRLIVAGIYGWGSAGAIVGAVVGSLAAHSQMTTLANFLLLSAAGTAVAVIATGSFFFTSATGPRAAPASHKNTPSSTGNSWLGNVRKSAWVSLPLATVAFCSFIAEATIDDWSGIYLRGALEAPPILTGAGYAAFQLGMLLGRVRGDSLISRFGSTFLVAVGSLIAGLTLLCALFLQNTPFAIFAFFIYGAGLALISPVVYRGAGNVTDQVKERVVANVTLGGYLGLLVGPIAIGFTAQIVGIAAAMAIPALLALAVAAMASILRASAYNVSPHPTSHQQRIGDPSDTRLQRQYGTLSEDLE